MKKPMIAVLAALAIGGAGVGAMALMPEASDGASVHSNVELQTASFAVENMTCATCPITVRKAMEGVTGVQEVTIDYPAKIATARFDPEATTAAAIAAASTNAGYPATQAEKAS